MPRIQSFTFFLSYVYFFYFYRLTIECVKLFCLLFICIYLLLFLDFILVILNNRKYVSKLIIYCFTVFKT